MSGKNILIVDDEIAILEVLRSSLKKLGNEYQVETVTDGYQALEMLNRTKFDLVVTDYKMVGINGLELLEAIHSIQPDTRVILMTAYGDQELEAKARRLKAHDFLHKPLEIEAFRLIVRESLTEIAINRPGILILSDNRYRELSQILTRLQGDIGARCAFLVDAGGQRIAQIGNTKDLPMDAISSLLGGGIATLTEAGRALDGDEDAINLAYREGKHVNFYAINIGQNLLLILIIERSPYSSKLGSVWYYAQNATQELIKTLGKTDFASTDDLLDSDSLNNLDKEFDKLFEMPDETAGESPSAAPPAQKPKEPKASKTPKAQEGVKAVPSSHKTAPQSSSQEYFSFDEAVKRGLVRPDVERKI